MNSPNSGSPTGRLQAEINQLFADEGVVLLEFSATPLPRRIQIRAIADRRQGGLTIDDCVYLSRQIQHLISEKGLLSTDYSLEVSSPGLDYPLTQPWQFSKNIGRLLKVRVPGEKGPREISGRLVAVGDQSITLRLEAREWVLRYDELLSAKVLPELKPPRMESQE